MKKLNKLIINPEKVIKNEELTNLRGGYDNGGYEDGVVIGCFSDTQFLGNIRTTYCSSEEIQKEMCKAQYPATTQTVCNELY